MGLSCVSRLCLAPFLLLGFVTVTAAAPAETSIEAAGPLGPLRGTMLSASVPKAPVVLIVPGSGPTDRDGNNPLGVRASSYRLLAEGLAARGISSVRIDKRGMFGSREAVADPNDVTVADYVRDLHAWASAIRRRTGVHCVWLLGHSEGGLIALAAAQKPQDLCGLVLVSTPGRRMAAILRDQLKSNPANAPILNQALAAVDAIEAGRRINDRMLHPALRPIFRSDVQNYLIDLFSYDPAALIAKVHKPVLIVQGARDMQIHEVDAKKLKLAYPEAKLVILPGVNHVLKPVKADSIPANLATYSDPDLPLAPGVVNAIADFIASGGQAR